MKRIIVVILVISVMVGLECSRKGKPIRIKMATTTSTENSSLLDVLLPAFKEKHNIEVSAIAVGTGKALKLGENGDVDLVLVHSRKAEDEFVKQGFGVNRRDVMYNDFIIVGPITNRIRVSWRSAAGLLKEIAWLKLPFISRGDESGTHKKEQELWQLVGLSPRGKWYLEAGQGMGSTLMMANEKQGYCLADRGTYIAYQDKINLAILCEGDSALFNPYGIIAVNPNRHSTVKYKEAMSFIEWIISVEGQKMIGEFKKNGQVLFHPVSKEN